MPLPASGQVFDDLMPIRGFLPVIIQVTPVYNLPMVLGLANPAAGGGGVPGQRVSRLDAPAGAPGE